jgi:hypothetical protein
VHRTNKQQHIAVEVIQVIKRTIIIRSIHSNTKLRQGTQLHIQVIKEVMAIHITPINEHIRHIATKK